MSAITMREVLAFNAATEQNAKPSLAEKQHYAERTLPVQLYDHAYGLGRHLLGSALFGIKRGERQRVKLTLPTYRGAEIEYVGPELRQDDATVLLELVHRTRKSVIDTCVGFDPREFVKALGWDAHKKSVEKLRGCIERMQESLVRLTAHDQGLRTHLVGSFDWSPERWIVNLDSRIVGLFQGGVTFIPKTERAALTDGLQTWLAGFIRAQSDETRFDLADLLRFSGSEAEAKTFGTQVRESMPKLVAAGVVKSFEFGRGRMTVVR